MDVFFFFVESVVKTVCAVRQKAIDQSAMVRTHAQKHHLGIKRIIVMFQPIPDISGARCGMIYFSLVRNGIDVFVAVRIDSAICRKDVLPENFRILSERPIF